MRYAAAARLLAAGIAGAVLGGGVLAGVALLLYAGPRVLAVAGFLASLALAAIAAALWVGVPAGPPRWLRGRWAAAVLAYLAASLFAGYWTGAAPPPRTGSLDAAAVLLLLAAPTYATAAVLAGLAERGRGTGAAALGGAAIGVLAAAVWLIPTLDARIFFAGGAVLLVAAGWIDSRAAPAARREGRAMDGRVVIVTGAGARGQVAYALAEAFLGRGARVVLTDVRPDVEALAAELGEHGDAVAIPADLTRADGAERVVAFARERFGRLDVLVNAAGGLTVIRPLAETTPQEWTRELDINARTTFLMSRAALPLLRESHGAIINFASPAGVRAVPRLGAYSAAKAGVVALTRALAMEEREHGVRVNAIAPGMIDTEQNRRSVLNPDAVKWVTREQIAGVVLFLASDAGSGVNGEIVGVPGEGVE